MDGNGCVPHPSLYFGLYSVVNNVSVTAEITYSMVHKCVTRYLLAMSHFVLYVLVKTSYH